MWTHWWVIQMPQINCSAYWILWSMFLLYCEYAMFSKNCLYPLWKINLPYNTRTPLWNQDFLICHNRFFTKTFCPHFGRWYASIMTFPNQQAPKQITNLQNTLENLNDFRLGILGNKKVLEKSRNGWRQMLVPSILSRNTFLVIAVKNYTW